MLFRKEVKIEMTVYLIGCAIVFAILLSAVYWMGESVEISISHTIWWLLLIALSWVTILLTVAGLIFEFTKYFGIKRHR